jgi:hypothetical protein
MNAGAADFLREKLASELRLDELYLFGSYRLFAADQGPAPTPTVESAILVATKAATPAGHAVRIVALEDESHWPQREELLAEMARRARGRAGRSKGIHVHDVPQTDLRPEHPWPVKFAAGDLPARVVVHLQTQLDAEAALVEPLIVAWKVFQGIQTGADAYTARIQRRLTPEAKQQLAAAGARTGDPILELPPGAERRSPWREHPELLARSPESRAILYGAFDDADFGWLVLLRDDPPDDVLVALEPWRPVLGTRAEIARNPRRRWWEAAWPRSAADLAAPKVVALYRTDRGRFALDEEGAWQPSIKTTLVVGRGPGAPVAYLCGLLNSELLDLWYAVRGKTPWHVRRNYEPKRMNEIPYRRPESDPRADEVAELVRAVARNRRALLRHRAVVRDLGRTLKDPWKTSPVEVDEAALVAELPATETVSVRLDPALAVEGAPSGRATRVGPGVLSLRKGQRETGRITGDVSRLDLLEAMLGAGPVTDVAPVVLPKDAAAHAARRRARVAEVRRLLAEGRELVEQIERLVCALYDLPPELADEVVAHAVARAQRTQTSDE